MSKLKLNNGVVKWLGGKKRVFHSIYPFFPKLTSATFVEPFLGGATFFLNTRYATYHLSDLNDDLINLYQQIKADPLAFLHYSEPLFVPQNNTSENYYRLRNQFNSCDNSIQRAALFLYLNRHGYNGLCRYNRKRRFNVPFGSYQAPYFPRNEILHFAQKASVASFSAESFEKVILRLKTTRHPTILYCDPPYAPLSATAPAFTSYISPKFTENEQHLLVQLVQEVSQNPNVFALLSNHDSPQIRSWYRSANHIHSFKAPRSVNCKKLRNPVPELLALFHPKARWAKQEDLPN